jgi:hypothetical protein
MDLTFKELKCPKCGEELEQANITVHDDVQMAKRCSDYDCDYWMIIVIPHEDYEYKVIKKLNK